MMFPAHHGLASEARSPCTMSFISTAFCTIQLSLNYYLSCSSLENPGTVG